MNAYYITWCVNILYISALIPQIVLNYRRRSTQGVSDGMLLLYFSAYCAKMIYSYNCQLPLAYRVQSPISTFLVFLLLIQRWNYKSENHSFFVNKVQGLFLFFAVCWSASFFYPYRVGYFCGWITAICFALYQLPQLIRVYRTQSSQGISRLFVGILLLATSLEFFSSLLLKLPLPSCLNGLRGIITYTLLLTSCTYYSKKPAKDGNDIHA